MVGRTAVVSTKTPFAVRYEDGYMGGLIPNENELEYFTNSNRYAGVIIICEARRHINVKPRYALSMTDWGSNMTIFVDGREMVDFRTIPSLSDSCHILVGEGNATSFGGGNEKGQYEIKILVDTPGKVFEVFALIVV